MTTRFRLVIFLLLCLPSFLAAEEKRPNIVFAFADDWGRYASAYGKLEPGGVNDVVRTPNIDRVASEGVLFTRAFVNAPSCTPCRSSLLSGQQFFRTGRGAILQGAIWDSSIPSYPLMLKAEGYHIGCTYKVWSPGTPRDAPYGGSEHAYNKSGGSFNGFSQTVSKSSKTEASIAAAKEKLLAQVRGNFQSFLADRKPDQPFCYWFGPTNCHRKWTQGSGKRLWGLNPDDLKGKLPPFLPDVEIVREDFCDYLGEVQAFDAAVGVLLKELEANGELDNTLIVISGDHGAPGFPNGKCNLYDFGVAVPLIARWGNAVKGGRVIDDFVCLPDLAPTFLEAGGVKPPKVMTARSILPLLKSEESGQIDATRDHVIVGRERHVASARTDYLPYPQRAIRTADYLYIRNFKPERWPMGTGPGHGEPEGDFPSYTTLANKTFDAFGDLDASPTKAWIITHREDEGMQRYFDIAFGRRPAEELYDLKKDPHQTNNIAGKEAYAVDKAKLAERLMTELKAAGDPRVTGDGETFDKAPFTQPFKK